MKATIQGKPDHVALHVGANDLNTERETKLISKSIVDLVCTLKSNSVEVWHLRKTKSSILKDNFIKAISNIFQ